MRQANAMLRSWSSKRDERQQGKQLFERQDEAFHNRDATTAPDGCVPRWFDTVPLDPLLKGS
jgi:hypothetical protein